MKVLRIATGARLEHFGDPIGEVPIENVPLERRQREAVAAAGCELVAEAPAGEPHITFPDDLYLSADLLRAFVARLDGAPAVLALARTPAIDDMAVTQDVVAGDDHVAWPVRYVVPGRSDEPRPIVVAVEGLELRKPMPAHVVPEGEIKLLATTRSILQIVTPIHLHGANMLSIMNRLAGWKPTGVLGVAAWIARRLGRKPDPGKAPPPMFYDVLRRMNRIGRNCDIHPTARIEASVIGDNCRVGAGAYVQFSSVGDGVDIGAGCTVLTSTLGAGTCLVTREWVSLSVVGEGCFFAPRFIQFAVVGRDAQVYPSMYYDFRLDGKPILTYFRGKLVDARTRFIGPIIGHRAKVAGGLALGPGRVVPNGVILYPNEDTVVNRLPLDLPEGRVVYAGS